MRDANNRAMKPLFILFALCVSAAPALAQEPVGCDKFKWPLDKERATLTGTDLPKLAFVDGPKVMNGASDLMVTVFGDKGRHARTTIGVAVLPLDAAVEVEGLFEVA